MMMKRIFVALFSLVLALGLGLAANESEAKRMGGGKSVGMSRNTSSMQQNAAPTRQATAPQAAPNTATQPRQSGASRWLGPIAGLAAGLGLAALFSHLGLGGMADGLGSILLMVALAAVVFFVIRRFTRGAKAAQPSYAGAGNYQQTYQAPAQQPAQPAQFEAQQGASLPPVPTGGCYSPAGAAASSLSAFPAGFDEAGFVRQAKLNFIRLQAANDRGDMDDIKTFTTPEVFAEVDMQYQERGRIEQKTEIIQVDAQALDVTQEDKRYVASVKFYGQLREEPTAAVTNFEEIWHLVKPLDGSTGWLVAGIQQIQ
jgi:predicted lipid-binding transport protein (Tim44 family)